MKNLKNLPLMGKKLESLECENKLCRRDGDGCLSIVTGGLDFSKDLRYLYRFIQRPQLIIQKQFFQPSCRDEMLYIFLLSSVLLI